MVARRSLGRQFGWLWSAYAVSTSPAAPGPTKASPTEKHARSVPAVSMTLCRPNELGLITSAGVFNPVYATYRLKQTPADRVARTLSAWSVTSNATIAALTAVWGVLASRTSLRAALAIAGLLLLATPLLLPRREHAAPRGRELAGSAARPAA